MRPLAFAALGLLGLAPLADAASVTVDSDIDAVSLFQDSARVTRVASLDAPAGRSTLRFENLPTAVDADALEARLSENARGVVRNAKIFQPEEREPSDAVEDAREALRAHLRETNRIKELQAIQRDRVDYAKKLADAFAENYGDLSENGTPLSLEQGLATWELVERTRKEADQAIADYDALLQERSETERELNRRLQQAIKQDARSRSVAEVEIDLDAPQSIQLFLRYQVREARWQPRYELRAAPAQATLNFGYLASVWQETGEDWTDVELSLHTNRASQYGNLPFLPPLHLQQADSADEEVFELSPFELNKKDKAGYRAQQSMAGSRLPTDLPPSQQQATITASSASFAVNLPARASVPSSEQPATLPLTSQRLPAAYWSETIPKLQLDAYLRAEATNSLDLPILPGLALAFVDGTLTSKVTLPQTLPGEKLELSLGIDPNIKVERIDGAQQNKDTGLFEKTVTLRRAFTNQITNRRPTAHKIVVVDQFPIATDAKIKIDRLAPPADAVVVPERRKDSGVFQWETVLEPGATRSFEIQYQVEFPRDWSLAPQP